MNNILFYSLAFLIYSSASFGQGAVTMDELRSGTSLSTTAPYVITDPGREGLFYYDPSDTQSADNGGTIVVNASRRFKRIYSGPIDARWFGMKADLTGQKGTDNAEAFMKAIDAAANNQVVMVPNGRYFVGSTVRLPLASTKKVMLVVFGDLYFGNGAGIWIEGPNQYFKSYGLIAGFNTGAATEEAFNNYTGTGVYLKNVSGCVIEVNEVKDFKYGIHLSADQSGSEPAGCKYNRISFNVIHHNHTQIRVSIAGSSGENGNWNNSSYWYGGQLGRGKSGSYGKGGWYGLQFIREKGCNAKEPMSGHVFYDVGFEGLEKAIVMADASSNAFIGGRFEGPALREGIDLDPETAVANKFIGEFAMVERYFIKGRMGLNTIVSATPVWSGTTNQVMMGTSASTSITPGKMLATINRYGYTNFNVNRSHDLISMTGQFPSVQAMMYRIDTVLRAVPFKKTFFQVGANTPGREVTLPPNIGLVRIEAGEEKIFKIDSGDLAKNGESFIVEYLSPSFPISFIRSDTVALLIPSGSFPSGGTYSCLWAGGQYRISKLGAEYEAAEQTDENAVVEDGIHIHYVSYAQGTAVVNLPPPARFPGRKIIIKNIQAGQKAQVNGIAADDEHIIEGRGVLTVLSDGEAWQVISFYLLQKDMDK